MNTNKKIIELKPCPFCGMKPDLEDGDTLYPSGIHWVEMDDEYYIYYRRSEAPEGSQPCWDIYCVEVAGGCGANITGHSKKDAIDKWNRRV